MPSGAACPAGGGVGLTVEVQQPRITASLTEHLTEVATFAGLSPFPKPP
jgi:hypothetical protein